MRIDFRDLWRKLGTRDPKRIYEVTRQLLKAVDYSNRDVEDFCIEMAEFQKEGNFAQKAGAVLSAMVNAGEHEHYVIHTDHLEKEIEMLGYKNTKNLSVRGKVGNSFCEMMESGLVFVTGDAAGSIGTRMKGGEIIAEKDVYGNVGKEMEDGGITVVGRVGRPDYIHVHNKNTIFIGDPFAVVGIKMKGGSITVNGDSGPLAGLYQEGGAIALIGNAGSCIGPRRKGGVITMDGSYESISCDCGAGEIFHKGKRVFPRTENVDDKVLRQLMGAWKAFSPSSSDTEGAYHNALDIVGGIGYSAEDVRKFSQAIDMFQTEPSFGRKAGLLLSALINNGTEPYYGVDLRKTRYKINLLGYRNTKTIRATGDLGSHTGRENMGIMIVEGSSGYGTGAYLNGGYLVVTGNAGDFLGIGMKEGAVAVFGEAGSNAGHYAEGGRISVNGEMLRYGHLDA